MTRPGITFSCPDCHNKVTIHAIVMSPDHEVELLADCDICEEQCKFNLAEALRHLCSSLMVRKFGGNTGVH